jgi:UDP-N-acetylglucosamine diphosphorylase/glucosamine-1-phosphate N-acetyltransferase
MKPAVVVLFEDEGHARLWPLAATRPVWDLRLGGHAVGDKLRAYFPDTQFACIGRAEVLAAAAEEDGALPSPRDLSIKGDVLWLNGRALADPRWLDALEGAKGPVRWLVGQRVLALKHAASLTAKVLAAPHLWEDASATVGLGFTEETLEAPFLDEIWDLLRHNHHELMVEGELAVRAVQSADLTPRANPATAEGVHLVEPSSMALHPSARIGPGAVLDASSGPIVVERDAWIEPHTYVVGPCWIGAGTHVLGGRLGGGVSLGPVCRVAGEIEESIFQGYANKRHHGFVGHSVVGAWVNLGALTTTSDLKNNYRPVRVVVDGVECDTGETKIGSFLGDHVKTSIGSLLTTGAVVGPASNLFAGGRMSPKSLPAFAWWDGEAVAPYELEKFLETAALVTSRRQRSFGEAQQQLYRTLAARSTP